MHSRQSLAERLLGLMGWIIITLLTVVVGSALITHALVLPPVSETISAVTGWVLLLLIALSLIVVLITRLKSDHL